MVGSACHTLIKALIDSAFALLEENSQAFLQISFLPTAHQAVSAHQAVGGRFMRCWGDRIFTLGENPLGSQIEHLSPLRNLLPRREVPWGSGKVYSSWISFLVTPPWDLFPKSNKAPPVHRIDTIKSIHISYPHLLSALLLMKQARFILRISASLNLLSAQ